MFNKQIRENSQTWKEKWRILEESGSLRQKLTPSSHRSDQKLLKKFPGIRKWVGGTNSEIGRRISSLLSMAENDESGA